MVKVKVSEAGAQEDVAPANVVMTHAAVQEPAARRHGPLAGKGRLLFEAVLVVLVIVLAVWAWNLRGDRNNLNSQLASINANPQLAVQKQTDTLLSSVGKLLQLPKGETPTIATVNDASKAKKQSAFFKNAQDGDKVLMYAKAGEAILYRPADNKIVLVAPLTFSDNGSKKSTGNTTTSATTDSNSSALSQGQ